MNKEEANKVLEEMHEVRPEMLNDKAKKLFEAIMKIADGRDKAEADLYEANNRIVDLMNIIEERDKIIYDIASAFKQDDIRSVEEIIKYFEERCK